MLKKLCFALLGGLLAASLVPTGSLAADPEIPFLKAWQGSSHADVKSESFVHWDKEGKVPEACVKCHTGEGLHDFLGLDGSQRGKIDKPGKIQSVVTCVTCHNEGTLGMTDVTFPSGLRVSADGDSGRCALCHQGRQSTVSVNAALMGKDADTVDDKLGFMNVHYRAAAATLWGTAAKGGYEYDGLEYAGRFAHRSDVDSCVECHDPHSLKVDAQECSACHVGIESKRDLTSIRRMAGDIDGDGDVKEGIALEIAGLHDMLGQEIMKYASTTAKAPIIYDSHAYPYFFNDKNADGKLDKGEGIYPNKYKSWTPRLMKAAYNYQFVAKDPGAYAHNPAYAVQLLHDALADLGRDMKGLTRP